MAIAAGIGALGTVAGSLLGGLFSSRSQTSANNANILMNRETNQMNRELFNQQLAWQEDMWNKTNAYNDPKHQVELLQRAGINPATVYGSGSTSDATMPSAPSAPQMQGVTVNPVDYSWIGNIVDKGVNAFFNNQILSNQVTKSSNEAQISKVQAELDTHALANRLAIIANDKSKSDFERETARQELRFLTTTFDQRVAQTEWTTKIMTQQYDELVNRIAESKLQQEAMRIANQYAPQLNDAQLKQYRANIANLYAAARNQDAQAVESAARKILTDLQSEGVKLDNKQKSGLIDPLIDKAWNEADKAYYDAGNAQKQFEGGRVGYELPNSSGDPFVPSDRRYKRVPSNSRHSKGGVR